MDSSVLAIIATGVGVISFFYMMIRDFKNDLKNTFNPRFDRIERRSQEIELANRETNKRMDGIYHLILNNLRKK